jgi:hypothetical protein
MSAGPSDLDAALANVDNQISAASAAVSAVANSQANFATALAEYIQSIQGFEPAVDLDPELAHINAQLASLQNLNTALLAVAATAAAQQNLLPATGS